MELLVVITIIGIVIALLLPAGQAMAAWTVGTPIVTYYAGPGNGWWVPQTDATATQLAEGGWNLVWASTEAELDVALAHGLRAMWIGPQYDATVNSIRNHPALNSYYVRDEPSASDFSELASTVSRLNGLDPNHAAYVNLLPSYASGAQLSGTGVRIDYPAYLSQYVSTVHPALLSYDNYQFTTAEGDRSDYFGNLAIISHAAKQAKIPFLNIVQACSYSASMRIPNGNELRYLYNTSLAYGATGVSSFVYSVRHIDFPDFTGGIANEDGTPTVLYNAAKTINPEFVAIAQQIQSMHHIGAYHLGDLPPGVVGANTTDGSSPLRLPGNSPFTLSPGIPNSELAGWNPVKGALLGLYGPDDLVTHATCTLVVNLDYVNALNTRVNGPDHLSVFDPATGKWIAQGHTWADVSLLPGGSALVGLTSAGCERLQ